MVYRAGVEFPTKATASVALVLTLVPLKDVPIIILIF